MYIFPELINDPGEESSITVSRGCAQKFVVFKFPYVYINPDLTDYGNYVITIALSDVDPPFKNENIYRVNLYVTGENSQTSTTLNTTSYSNTSIPQTSQQTNVTIPNENDAGYEQYI